MRKLLWMMTFATMFSTLSVEFLAPFYAIFVGEIGGGLVLAGATWAVYRLGSAVVMFFSGRLADSYPAENFVLMGFALRVVGTGAYFFVTSPVHLILVQILQGFGHALIGPAYRKIYSQHLDGGHEAAEWSYPQVGHEISMAIAALAGGIIAEQLGFMSLFTFMFIAHIASFLCAWRVWRMVRSEKRELIRNVGES